MKETITRKERDRLLRESDFLEAAERLFSRNGYYATSMEDVAREAEYATGTIYRYFASKEALYHELLLRRGRAYFKSAEQAFKAQGSAVQKIRTLIRCKIGFFEANGEFLQIYLSELAGQFGEEETTGTGCRPPKELKDEFVKYLSGVRNVFEQGMREETVRKLNPDYMVSAFIGMSNELLHSELEKGMDGDALESFMYDILAGGFLTAKGRKK